MPDLHIPDRAMQAAVEGLQPITVDSRDIEAVLWSAAPIVVAAELRRLAGLDNGGALRTAVRARADELDPPRS